MSRFRSIYRCPHCGTTWKGRVRSSHDAAGKESVPKCPNLACKSEQTPRGIDLSLGKAPAQIGQNVRVKAIDETAKIVMEDHHMTDLRTDVRPTETATPKLAPLLQAQADGFFGAGRSAAPRGTVPFRSPLQTAAMQAASNALSGKSRQESFGLSNPIADVHRRRMRVPVIPINREPAR